MSRNQQSDKAKIIAELEKIPIVGLACGKTGVSRATYYRWRHDDPDFAYDCDQAMEVGKPALDDFVESKLLTLIDQLKLSAIQFYLRSRHPNYQRKYKEEGERSRKSRNGEPLPDELKLTPEEEEELFRRGDAIMKAMNDEEIPVELLQDSIAD